MKKNWARTLLIALAALSLGAVPVLAEEEKYTIVYVSRNMSDMFGSFIEKMVRSVAESEYENFEIKTLDLGDDFSKNSEFIENAVTMGADAIIGQFLMVDPADAARRAMDEGIPVICIDYIHEDSFGVYPQITADNYGMGALIGADAAEKLPENAKVAILSITNLFMAAERDRGIAETLAELRPDVTIVDTANCEFDKNAAIQIATDWITEYGQLDGILTDSDTCALGAIEAYRAAGLNLDDTLFYGVDGGSDACYSIKEGELDATILQSAEAYARESLALCQQYFDGEIDMTSATEQPHIEMPPTLINEDNVDELIKTYTDAGVM